MDTTKPPRGFTTAILHSDRDAGIEHGALHKPLHVSVAYGYRDARDLAAVFQGRAQGYAYGRQGNPTTAALEAKVTKMEDGVATVCFATGMAAIGALMLALLREGDHVVVSQFLFGNTVSQFNTLVAHGADITFVDATDVANVERALTPATRLIFVETIANPRTQIADLARIGALAKERGILYVVDNTMTSPALFRPKAVRRGARDQRADQIHRRPRQRARRQHHRHRPLRLDALSPTSPRTTSRSRPRCGESSRSARRGCATGARTLAAGDAHPIAVGAETLALRMERTCANALALAAVSRLASAGCARSTTRDCRRIRSMRSRARSFAAFGGLFAFELADGIDCFDFLNRLEHRRLVVESGRQPDARDTGRAHDLLGDGRRASRGNGHCRCADPRLGGNRGPRRSDRRFHAGARGSVIRRCAARASGQISRVRPPSASNSR